jgi:hypothetical protein
MYEIWMYEDYHFQLAWGTWKENVQIHHSYSKISLNSPHFSQDSSSDYGHAPCSASKSKTNTVLLYSQKKAKMDHFKNRNQTQTN